MVFLDCNVFKLAKFAQNHYYEKKKKLDLCSLCSLLSHNTLHKRNGAAAHSREKTKLILYAGKTAQKSEEQQLNPLKNILMFICEV